MPDFYKLPDFKCSDSSYEAEAQFPIRNALQFRLTKMTGHCPTSTRSTPSIIWLPCRSNFHEVSHDPQK